MAVSFKGRNKLLVVIGLSAFQTGKCVIAFPVAIIHKASGRLIAVPP
jgi:hypothetical protein